VIKNKLTGKSTARTMRVSCRPVRLALNITVLAIACTSAIANARQVPPTAETILEHSRLLADTSTWSMLHYNCYWFDRRHVLYTDLARHCNVLDVSAPDSNGIRIHPKPALDAIGDSLLIWHSSVELSPDHTMFLLYDHDRKTVTIWNTDGTQMAAWSHVDCQDVAWQPSSNGLIMFYRSTAELNKRQTPTYIQRGSKRFNNIVLALPQNNPYAAVTVRNGAMFIFSSPSNRVSDAAVTILRYQGDRFGVPLRSSFHLNGVVTSITPIVSPSGKRILWLVDRPGRDVKGVAGEAGADANVHSHFELYTSDSAGGNPMYLGAFPDSGAHRHGLANIQWKLDDQTVSYVYNERLYEYAIK
jgi:hypothetical protein